MNINKQALITTLTMAIAITTSMPQRSVAQCSTPFGQRGHLLIQPMITAAVFMDYSLKQFQPSGFNGAGVHAGIWAADHLGVLAGYAEYKLNDSTVAQRAATITLAVKITAMKERINVIPYFSHGTSNYQDIGVRAGFDIWNNGIYVGGIFSRTMHYGLSVTITTKRNNR